MKRPHSQTAELLRNIGETDTTRRDFLVKSLLALTGVSISLMGCGKSSASNTSAAGDFGSVSANHGHEAFISTAQLSAGDSLILDITGDSDHPHTVTLSAGQVQSIANGARVSALSTNDAGHNHIVTFN